MDCRRPLALAFYLVAGAAGCSQHAATVPVAAAPSSITTSSKSDVLDPEALKRQPKPETFVAFGDYSAREASSSKVPAEQEQLRDKARRAYQEALKLDPANVAAQKSLARLYIATCDYARAKEAYEATLKVTPDDAAVWFELGMTYARTKEWGPSVDHLTHAVELDPENRSYHRYLGFALARAGRTEESLAAFTRYEGEAKAHYYLAEMLEHLGQVDQCKTQVQLALAKDPQLGDAAKMLIRLNGGTPAGSVPQSSGSEVQTVGWTDSAQPPAKPALPKMLPPPPPLPLNALEETAPGAGK